ncbi:hypothetical protein AB0L44_44940 [Nonomuraea wenchangensis]|uniref:hypothetical protein n=1 Tax=Nonomuraea wenchangensis TaxID=568860 RepID=UPI00342B40F0
MNPLVGRAHRARAGGRPAGAGVAVPARIRRARDLHPDAAAALEPVGHVLLSALMFIGRIDPPTLGSALALKQRARCYELPEEKVIIG